MRALEREATIVLFNRDLLDCRGVALDHTGSGFENVEATALSNAAVSHVHFNSNLSSR